MDSLQDMYNKSRGKIQIEDLIPYILLNSSKIQALEEFLMSSSKEDRKKYDDILNKITSHNSLSLQHDMDNIDS